VVILILETLTVSVADPHNFDADPDADPDPACHFDADPDPACHFDVDPYADPDPTFHFDTDADPDPNPSFQIKEQNLEKVLTKQAQIPYILACHMQHDAGPQSGGVSPQSGAWCSNVRCVVVKWDVVQQSGV
jgi:hypothetical protein